MTDQEAVRVARIIRRLSGFDGQPVPWLDATLIIAELEDLCRPRATVGSHEVRFKNGPYPPKMHVDEVELMSTDLFNGLPKRGGTAFRAPEET